MVAKRYILLNLVVIALLLWPGAAAAAPAGVTMKVEPFWSGHFKFGEWLPLRVTLANDGPPLRAEVRADTTEAGGRTLYVVPVELPTGARKSVVVYLLPPSFAQAVRVRLMEGNREIAQQSVDVTLERNVNYLVGIVAPRPEPFTTLGSLTLNQSAVPQNEIMLKMMGGPVNPRPVRPIPFSLADIPERAEPLRTMDALVISGVDTSALSPAQRQAIRSWVEGGGRLILGGGASAARTLAGLPESLVADLREAGGSPAEIASLDGLARYGGQDIRVPGPFVVSWPAAGAASLIDQSGQALVVEKPVGKGRVTYVGLDLAGSPFDAWAGAARFWEKLITPGSSYPPGAPVDVAPRLSQANSFMYALQNLPALALPSIRWLGILLALYIVLVGPVNYVLLRRLRKLEWGWVTIGALTLAFSAIAFGAGYAMRGGEVIINKISIVPLGNPGALMTSYVGIFSPSRQSYTLNLPAGTLLAPVNMEGNPWMSQPMTSINSADIVEGDPVQVRGVQVNQWSMQTFQTERAAPEDWEIESDLTLSGNHVRGTLTNRTSEVLRNIVIVNNNQYIKLGDIQPGQSLAVDQDMQSSGGQVFPYFLTQEDFKNPGIGGPSRDAQVRQMVLSNYYQSPGMPPQPPVHPTLIAWMNASPLDVGVSNMRWSTQATSLIISEVDLHYAAGPVYLAPGSLRVRLANMQGDGGMCGPSPNQIILQSNAQAEIEFALPGDLARLKIKRMSISMPVAPSMPQVELLDRQGRWIKLADAANKNDPSVLLDPARFVSAAGVIRIRLSNDGGMKDCMMYDLDIQGELENQD